MREIKYRVWLKEAKKLKPVFAIDFKNKFGWKLRERNNKGEAMNKELDNILNTFHETWDKKEALASLRKIILEARIEELKKVGCCDYWEEGCSLNVCHEDQLDRIKELEALYGEEES